MPISYSKGKKRSGMMSLHNKIPLLTIAIPTYNRAKSLFECLTCLKNANPQNFNIEVIVSDNASTDNTKQIVEKFSKEFPISYFRNDENLGPNKNFYLLTDVYAHGKYCWLLGDDDRVTPDSIKNIVNALMQYPMTCYLTFPCQIITEKYFKKCRVIRYNYKKPKVIVTSFFKAIDLATSPGNLLATFISISIFKTSLFRKINKLSLGEGYSNHISTFPHTYIFITEFNQFPAIFINKILVDSVPVPEKSYSSKMPIILNQFIPNLLHLCEEYGLNIRNAPLLKSQLFYQNFRYIVLHMNAAIEQKLDLSYIYRAPLQFGFLHCFLMDILRKIRDLRYR